MGNRIGLAHLGGVALAVVSGALTNANLRGHTMATPDVVALALYLPIAMVVCGVRSHHIYCRATDWLAEGRPPSPSEQRGVLSLPLREALEGLLPWIAAAVIWGLLDGVYEHSGLAFTLRTSLSIGLGGLAASAIAYLLAERVLRPVFALALAGDVPERAGSLGVRAKLLLSWALGCDVFLVSIGLTFLGRPANRPPSAAAIWFLVASGLVAGFIVLYVAANSLADPLRQLRHAVDRVQRGDLDVDVSVDDAGELGLLQAGFNHMVVGLRERGRLQDLFGRHVGTEVAQQALAAGVALGGERREVSVLFVDLIGSTTLAQTRAPDQVVAMLNRLFGVIVRAVDAEGGWVNKFQGDGALCVFGAPADQPDHARRALRAARTIRRELLALAATQTGLDAAIGVSAGEVVAGNIGAEDRYEYTVTGDPVNEAARLTEEAKTHLGRVLASEEAVARSAGEAQSWVVVDEVTLRGRALATLVFEPNGYEAVRTEVTSA
ncbi:MAG: Adenylate cyclase, family protein 3 [Acidimicrobiales bacterium]|nr:Adenylate cyclase, family protein 3 [Acidimicrobiales bacterium]